MHKPKIVFCASPALAIPSLEALINSQSYEIAAVISQADQPAGRGQKLTPPPVKVFAEKHQIKVLQPSSLKKISLENGQLSTTDQRTENIELVNYLNQQKPIALMIIVAYGKIIPPALLEFPEFGCLNIHMSLLPKWRGAAPIQRAILNGDTCSGVSIMKLDVGLDTGPIYATESILLDKNETSGSLTDKLSVLGSKLLLKVLPEIFSGNLKAITQAATGACYAEKLSAQDFIINWNDSAEKILCKIRAGDPQPGARTDYQNEKIKIFKAKIARSLPHYENKPGTIVESNKVELIVSTGNNQYICLEELQFPGKKRLPVVEILKGKNIPKGERFIVNE